MDPTQNPNQISTDVNQDQTGGGLRLDASVICNVALGAAIAYGVVKAVEYGVAHFSKGENDEKTKKN